MARKPRPLPIYLQVRPKREVDMLTSTRIGNWHFTHYESVHLPKPRINPQHRAGRVRRSEPNLPAYLAWASQPEILVVPRSPIGRGRYVVRVQYPQLPAPVDSVYLRSLTTAHALALAITEYGGLTATAHQR